MNGRFKKIISLLIIPMILSSCSKGNKSDSESELFSDGYECEVRIYKSEYDNEVLRTYTVLYNHLMPSIYTPAETINHYTFAGYYTKINNEKKVVYKDWTYVKGYEVLSSKNYDFTGNVVKLYLNYEPVDIKVNLRFNNEKIVDRSFVISYGSTINELPVIDVQYHDFVGWYTISPLGSKIYPYLNGKYRENYCTVIDTYYDIVNNEVTLYAEYATHNQIVTLVLNDGSSTEVKIPMGERIDNYVKNIRINGHVVTKWSTVENDKSFEHVFNDIVLKDMTLYASEYVYLLLTLKAGTYTEERFVFDNEKVMLPINVTLGGMNVVRWTDGSSYYTDSIVVSKETTLTALKS